MAHSEQIHEVHHAAFAMGLDDIRDGFDIVLGGFGGVVAACAEVCVLWAWRWHRADFSRILGMFGGMSGREVGHRWGLGGFRFRVGGARLVE